MFVVETQIVGVDGGGVGESGADDVADGGVERAEGDGGVAHLVPGAGAQHGQVADGVGVGAAGGGHPARKLGAVDAGAGVAAAERELRACGQAAGSQAGGNDGDGFVEPVLAADGRAGALGGGGHVSL